jgi:uracil-DNA glycosylase
MINQLRTEIEQHPSNAVFHDLGYSPLFSASPTAKIVIIGQAPGKKAQETGMVWNDASGERLIRWLGITEETFRDPALISHMPMDFYYPGKGPSGDLPPRKDFAKLWHAKLLQQMPAIELMILIGQYAQNYYLGNSKHSSLTEVVRNYREYLPGYFPLVHPSPLNFRWFGKNEWFEKEVVPALQARVGQILTT